MAALSEHFHLTGLSEELQNDCSTCRYRRQEVSVGFPHFETTLKSVIAFQPTHCGQFPVHRTLYWGQSDETSNYLEKRAKAHCT
jgi:hypothetical protein